MEAGSEEGGKKMLILIAALLFGALYLTRAPRLVKASEIRPEKKVRAYIDGKPVVSYVKEH